VTLRSAPNEISVLTDGSSVLQLPYPAINGTTNTVVAAASDVTVAADGSTPIVWGAYTNEVAGTSSVVVPEGTAATFVYLDLYASWLVTACSSSSAFAIGNNFDTAGQLIVGSGPFSATILDPGTAGQYLVTDPAQPAGLKWYTTPPPLTSNPAAMIQPTNQTIVGPGAWTRVTSMASVYAVGGTTVSGSSVAVPVTGIYRVSYQLKWQNTGAQPPAGAYVAGVLKGSGTSNVLSESGTTTDAAHYPYCGGTIDLNLAAGDTVSLGGIQSTGANQGTAYDGYGADNACTWLSLSLVSR
jgi:hypothetical protein